MFNKSVLNKPKVVVTKEEFIKLMMDAGESKEYAERQAWFAQKLGSGCVIGDKIVEIKK